jgi:DNA-binding transcriptional LysR family regulator
MNGLPGRASFWNKRETTMIGNLEYYKVFYYVAKRGSLTLAAAELSISQPAVSQSVKQLENALGVKLFTRVSKGVKLTGEGELLYGYVAKGYEQIILGEQKLKQMLNLDLGEIHIGASDMTLQYYLLPYLERFHEVYPGIKIIVTNAPTPETLKNLREGIIDFGIVSTPFAVEHEMQTKEVREIEDIFVAGRKFISYKNKMLDLQELEHLPIICLEGETSSRSYMEGFLRQNHVEMKPEFELATSDMIVQFALRNLGVGCVMRDFAREYLESGQLFEFRFNKIIPKRHFCVVTDARTQVSVAAKNLLELVYEGGHEK